MKEREKGRQRGEREREIERKRSEREWKKYIHASLERSVMYSGINSVPPLNAVIPVGAEPYASPLASIYFIVYMMLMTFVLLQLFIGVVIVAFQAVGVKAFRETKLDRNQV
jgi:hypothetical protein